MIPTDKKLHLLAGIIIASIFVHTSPILSIGMVSLIAISKEVYDKVSGKGTPELMDILYTLIGGGIPIILHYLSSSLL
jgi:hypothetical protein